MSESLVAEFYNGKNVFVTGVTGFLAKAVVEKLLRLTNVNRIYVLVREKRGKSVRTRLDEVKKNLNTYKWTNNKSVSVPVNRRSLLTQMTGLQAIQNASVALNLMNDRNLVTFREATLVNGLVRFLQRSHLQPPYKNILLFWKLRSTSLIQNEIFERLKREKGETILEKLLPVAGDVSVDNLGMSDSDKKLLLDEVNIIFHSAATLDFELNAKLVVNINLLGTRRMLEFASQINHLQAFVYVSTAYVNSDKTFAVEKLYPKPGNVDDFIALLKLKDEEADRTLAKMMNGHINSYTISKALAEHEVHNYKRKFPSAIVRPSMIVGAWQEPVPGWTDSKNGPTGFFMGAGMGIIRRLPVNRDLVYDYIPVDIVTNELIVAGWHVGTNNSQEIEIYHCTSSTTKPFCWNLIDEKINTMLINYPLKSAVWYPTVKLHQSFILFRISTIFLHFLPGFFFDILLRLCGKKPMLVKLHYRVDTSLCRLAPFIFKEWFFDSTNTDKLYDSLTDDDRSIFNLNIRNINYGEFFEDAVIGVRRYLNKEKDETLGAARKKVKVFYFLNCLMQMAFLLAIWWLTAAIFGKNMLFSIWILPVAYFLFSLL